MRRALRLAHRGDWRAGPENSAAAFRAALAIPGCDGLEFDVRAARDGTPIVLHDATLARVQGRPEAAADLDVAALAAAGVPTLASVLDLAGPPAFLDIEMKGPPVRAAVEVIEAARGPHPALTVISSFEPGTLRWFGRQRPGWPRWLNAVDLGPDTIALAGALGCRGIAAEWRAIDVAGIARAAAAALEVAGWTVRRRSTAHRLERLGVAAICVEAAALDG